MSTDPEQQEQTSVDSPPAVAANATRPPPAETEQAPAVSSTDEKSSPAEQPVATEEQKPPPSSSSSSWFNNFGLSPNLTSQLTNLSSSLLQVTSKVSAAANTLVQKTLPQRPTTPNQIEQTEGTTTTDENQQQTEPPTEDHKGAAGANKDLTSILTDLSSTVMKSAQQLKHVVEEKSLIGNFTKEHEKFVTEKRTQQRREEAAVPPWVGYVEEEEMKNQILALSKEKRNFLRNPPPGANYHFDMTAVYPVALATLEADENLKQMRFDLVPKQVNEESFWRNYFYRVSLIKQSTQLSALTHENANTQSTDGDHNASKERGRKLSESQDKSQDMNQEFVSEDYDTSDVNMDDIRREIEQLTVTKKNPNSKGSGGKAASADADDSEWDKTMADDLDNVSAEELEAQINQMLAGDTQ